MLLVVRTIRGPSLVPIVERFVGPVIMSAVAHCIVSEQTRTWATALRCGLGADAGRVIEVRGWDATLDALRAAPASIVVTEVANIDLVTWAERCTTIQLVFPQARWLVVGESELWDCELDWLQLGAVSLVDSPRAITRVLPNIRRHLQQHPPARRSLRQRIWEQLPWADISHTQPEGSIHD